VSDPLASSLVDKIVALVHTFEDAATPYAFGGALALAYYGEPRVTVDVDVNLFVPPSDVDAIARLLEPLGIEVNATMREAVRRDGQARFRWGETPVDVFFSYDAFHEQAATRVRRVPFGPVTMRILGPEDLVVCKAVFDRRKDWIDIDQVLALTAGELDIHDIRSWLVAIVGAADERVARFDRAVATVLGDT
jgi:hypothetical protein